MELLLKEYEKLGIIGRGGFATVWKVRHHQFRNIRAIKELHEPIYDSDPKLFKSFCKESETLLRLGNGGHPNIIKIFRSILDDHRAYFEMDFVEGETLYNYLREKKFIPINEVMKFVSDIGSALAYCHEDIYLFCMDREIDDLPPNPDDASKVLIDDAKRKKLIEKYKVWHNDIQSKNVMRKINGSYMLFDFGLSVSDEGEITSSKKKNGIVEYMSPEKLDKGIFDARSDVYSFGILMYEILAGRVPFEIEDGKNREAISEQVKILEKHKNAMPPAIEPLRRAAFEAAHQGKTYEKDYPDWLEQMIMKCLEKKPENRYATAKDFFTEFEKNSKASRLEDSEQTKKLKESNEKMIKDLSNLSREKDELNEQIRMWALSGNQEEKIAQLQNNIKLLMNKCEKLQSEIDDKNSDAAILQNKIKLLQTDNYELQSNILKQKNEKPNRKLVSILIALSLFFAVLTGVSVLAYIGKDSRMLQLVNDKKNLTQQLDTLKTSNVHLQSLMSNQGNNNVTLANKQKEIDRLQQENTNLRANQDASTVDKNTVSRLQQDNNNLTSSNQEKDRTISNLKSSDQEKDKTIVKLQQDLQTARDYIKNLH